VHKGGQPVDPANYFFNDLTPEEYARMLDISRNAGNRWIDRRAVPMPIQGKHHREAVPPSVRWRNASA
jgi:hypothetical protein